MKEKVERHYSDADVLCNCTPMRLGAVIQVGEEFSKKADNKRFMNLSFTLQDRILPNLHQTCSDDSGNYINPKSAMVHKSNFS